ncbi:hypothetical protein [Streptomyces longispororuber]|uniref:hypothetical protein n=1 Tax=Streptomyces longispororuber TaxID=68230 RepID=UPI0036F4F97E
MSYPSAGQTSDPRALALAQARQERLVRESMYGAKRAPGWEELTDRQRAARVAAAAEWIEDAFQARLLPYELQPRPDAEQFAAIEKFLTARRKEIEDATYRGDIPHVVCRAATMFGDRLRENLIHVRLALHGDSEAGLEPSWSVRHEARWADTLHCAKLFQDHDDYAPASWTP